MANVDTHEEFWGITLSGDKKTHTWNPADAEEEMEHKIQVTQACLGQKAKEGERNVIEVSTEDDNGKKISCSVVSLRVGFNECMHLELGFTNPVKFVLKDGSGPISLCGVHMMALPLDLNNVDDDSSEDEDKVVPQVLEVVGTKAKIEELPKEKMDTEEITIKKSEPAKSNVPVDDKNTKKSDAKELVEKPKEKENVDKEVDVKKSKKRVLSEEVEVVSAKKKKEEIKEKKVDDKKEVAEEEGKKKVEESVADKGEEEELEDDDLEDADSEDGDEESGDDDEDDDMEEDDTDDDADGEDIDMGEDSDDMDADGEGSDEEEDESKDEKPKTKQQTKVNGNLAPAKKQHTKVNGKEKGKQTKPKANTENINNNSNNSNDKNTTPKGKKNKETHKNDTTGTPHKRTKEELRSSLLKSPNLPKKYEKFANYMKNNMKVTDAKVQKELWDFVQKNKK